MQKLSFLLIMVLTMVFFMISCGEESKLCGDITCEEWQSCEEETCKLSDGRCEVTNNCSPGMICDLDKYICITPPPPCHNITCSRHGTCKEDSNSAFCECNDHYVPDGLDCVPVADTTPFITTWKTDNSGISSDNEVRIPIVRQLFSYNYHLDCNSDGIYEYQNQGGDSQALCTFDTPGTYTISILGEFPTFNFGGEGDKDKLLSVEQWGSIAWKIMMGLFIGCNNVVINAIDAPNLSQVEDLSYMFAGASSFNQDISNWDVSNVYNMSYMFNEATSFNQPLNEWDVSNVTDMSGMFDGASSFNQDISNWDVSNVYNMSYMFSEATSFNQPLNEWDVSNVTDMSGMFSSASSFNQNLSSWNVEQVTDCAGFSTEAISWTLPKPNFTNCTL